MRCLAKRTFPVAILWVFTTGAAQRGCVEQSAQDQQWLAAQPSAVNPATGECQLFAAVEDMPAGWDRCRSPDLQRLCMQVITHAASPDDGRCHAFSTPCDVPDDWEPCHH
jgi:hypothetical protein